MIEEKGPEGFSIAEASRTAGVSTAAPYKHFKDKPDIIRAVVVAGMQRLGEAMIEAPSAATGTDQDKIVAMGAAHVNFARKEPGVFRLMWRLSSRSCGNPQQMNGLSHFATITGGADVPPVMG